MTYSASTSDGADWGYRDHDKGGADVIIIERPVRLIGRQGEAMHGVGVQNDDMLGVGGVRSAPELGLAEPDRPGGGFVDGDVEDMLRQAESFFRRALSRFRSVSAAGSVTSMHDEREGRERAQRAVWSAKREIVCVTSATPSRFDMVPAPVPSLPAPIQRGVVSRIVFTLPPGWDRLSRRGLGERGRKVLPGKVETRVLNSHPFQMLIVDSQILFVRGGTAASRWALMVDDPEIASIQRLFFLGLWQMAVPAERSGPGCGHRECDVTNAVLRAMEDGKKDDLAARELGISVRTYRRHVAIVLRQLGAETRFQAGMLARNTTTGCSKLYSEILEGAVTAGGGG